jgi:hypothetical protein
MIRVRWKAASSNSGPALVVSQFEQGSWPRTPSPDGSRSYIFWRQALEGSALSDRISAVVMIASMILIWGSWAYAVFCAIKRAAL